MAEIRVCPLLPENIAEVAAYLAELRRSELTGDGPFDLATETQAIEARMRWQLVDNPACLVEPVGGHFLRDHGGLVVGTHLAIPVRFVSAGRPLVGLLSADLRAEPHAARYSSGMFLAYLRMRGGDFHYATTANRNAGAFWEQRRAAAVPGSDLEFISPVRLGPFLEELAARWKPGALTARAAGVVGAVGDWSARARRFFLQPPPIRDLEVAPCADWEHLSALAVRHRDPEVLTNERSTAYLRWRYQSAPGSERNRVFLIEQRGKQAWAALQFVTVGAERRLREARLMDLVWPQGELDAVSVLHAVFERCRDDCDMVRIKGGTVPDAAARRLGFWLRRLDGPTSYVAGIDAEGAPLALRAQLAAADSDTP